MHPLQKTHQITGHDIGRGQRLTGMDKQGFGIELGIDDEQGAGFARRGHDVGGRSALHPGRVCQNQRPRASCVAVPRTRASASGRSG